MSDPIKVPVIKTGAAAIIGLILVGLLLFGGAAGCSSYGRYQKRQDVKNKIVLQTRQLALYDLQVKQAVKLAQVKKEQAIGQKLANEQISRRLTPLFVQYEMIEALKAIAASGKNNSVIYIPSGANGVPLIAPTGQQVYGGASAGK